VGVGLLFKVFGEDGLLAIALRSTPNSGLCGLAGYDQVGVVSVRV